MQLYDYDKVITDLKKQKIELTFVSELKSGKEACVWKVLANGEIQALKIFKNHNLRGFNTFEKYWEGTYIKSRTLRQAVAKKTNLGRQFVQDSWVQREFDCLKRLHSAGCFVPKPYAKGSNCVLMQYIGNDNMPAPTLNMIKLSEEAALYCFDTIFEHIKTFFDIGFIHGDLSAFNILWWDEKPWIIDFPQGVNVKTNSRAKEILYKDLNSLYKYFDRFCRLDKNYYESNLAEHIRFILW